MLHIVIRSKPEKAIHTGFIYNPLSIANNSEATKIYESFFLPGRSYITVCMKTANTVEDVCNTLRVRLATKTGIGVSNLIGTFTFSHEIFDLLLHEVWENQSAYAA